MKRYAPSCLTLGGSKLGEVFDAVRDHGPLRVEQVAARTGYGANQVAPLLGFLCIMRRLVHHGDMFYTTRHLAQLRDTL